MDQADELRRLVRHAVDQCGELAPGAPVVVLSGAQPDVGVTTAACGLARELARLGKAVVLVDAHLEHPAVALQFEAKPIGTLGDVLAGRRRAVEILAAAADGVRILAGCEPPGAAALDADAIAHFAAELAALSRQADVVLLDAGYGMNPWTDRLWQLASRVLLVTTPARQAVVDAYAAVKLAQFDRLDGKLQLVVTRCDSGGDAERVHAGLNATCGRFLGAEIRAPAVLPTLQPEAAAPFDRSLRLLAADLACDFRALSVRLRGRGPRPALRATPAPSPSSRLAGPDPTADS